ncbi:hypothetical protein CCGE531_29890 (plasmid) [Rhizobium sp. CCGE531]|nr:hypothetical protein CCGE531_29890 [Rhizobium sp. CCGE531]
MDASADHVEIYVDARFPLEEVNIIAARLDASKALVAGYIPPSVGMLNVGAMKFEKLSGCSFVLLPDRNIVSRMARVASGRELHPFEKTAQLAVDLMAYAQAMDIEIEPSVSFHELAHMSGNEIANLELSHFRGADQGQADAWIELAMGRTSKLRSFNPGELLELDLAAPLSRWRRNYLVALKVGDLELADLTPTERAVSLLEWMEKDYFVAGPGLLYGMMFLGPIARKADLFKQLRSPARDRAIAGIKNAAWDMTHLSDFLKRVQDALTGDSSRRFLFATGDERLANIARVLFSLVREEESLKNDIENVLREWWPRRDAEALAELTFKQLALAGRRPPPSFKGESSDPIRDWTTEAEGRILHRR